jgi:hypothetical protein
MPRSKKQPNPAPETAPAAVPNRRSRTVLVYLVVILALAAVPVLMLILGSSSGPDFQRLVGRWSRIEGGYILEIKKASADGELEVKYVNPQRGEIHVERARAEPEGASFRVTVELRDRGYEGSNYTLQYDPQRDELHGRYKAIFGEESQESDVSFMREK